MIGAEGAFDFEALEAQAAAMMNLFVASGYERVAPAFIQPAGLFLDLTGETIRARTFVFTDPNGEELCLRPDLTIPVCRLFLERNPKRLPVRYCYNGPAFRAQEGPADPLRPREFRQAGVEVIGAPGPDADRDVLAITLEAVQRAGLRKVTLRLGHVGIFDAILNALPMPDRWRRRLARRFWRPHSFAAELKRLSGLQPSDRAMDDLHAVTDAAALHLELEARALPFFGNRSPEEVAERLREKQADAREKPLPVDQKRLLEDALKIEGPLDPACDRIHKLGLEAGCNLEPHIHQLRDLTDAARAVGIEAVMTFESGFGRHFEYYTGAVFQIEIAGKGLLGQVAGGGRYDTLISALSGGPSIPAVGAAINTERVLLNAGQARS
jgi:ATP phosphoribosyltransferase regulatory subunit